MSISLAAAKAAIDGITSSGSNLFKVVQGNVTMHDKSHWSKQQAQAAIAGGKPLCGYYYKIGSDLMFKNKETGDIADPSDVSGAQRKKSAPSGGGKLWQQVKVPAELPITLEDATNIVVAALNKKSTAVYKENTPPGQKISYFVDLPEGFGATTLYQNGAPQAAEKVLLVVNCGGTNPQLITHFPCHHSRMTNFPDLT